MRRLPVPILILLALPGLSHAQIGVSHPSLEALVASADLVVRGTASAMRLHATDEQGAWSDLTIKVEETLKGAARETVTIALRANPRDPRWLRLDAGGPEDLWFLVNSGTALAGETEKEKQIHARHDFKGINYWDRVRLGPAGPGVREDRPPLGAIFTMHFEFLDTPEKILVAARRAVAEEPRVRAPQYVFAMPGLLAAQTGRRGDANTFRVPRDGRLELLAHTLVKDAESLLPALPSDPGWRQFEADRLRAEGAQALQFFKSEENIALLKSLLDHPAKVGRTAVEEKDYFVRRAAYQVLEQWTVAVEKPVLVEGRDARPPRNDDELRYWLQNMLWHHKFRPVEIAAAIGLDGEDEIDKELRRFDIRWNNKPERGPEDPLLVLPYPGGRHPRIGFLEGAINPQRETKISVFTPWDEESYVVADLPEAIWSNLGLTYLAHTHVPTIWTKQNIDLEKLEWNRRENGTYDMQRKLPNGIEFGTRVIPGRDAVRMEMWLKNGTNEKLTDLRVQNCVMLKGAAGFEAQNNDNKVLQNPYVAVHDDEKNRWIITAWDPCHRPWANAPCPCLHSDPKFPDCAPGETRHLKGWLSFYQGADLQAELKRIEATGWRGVME